MRKSGLRKITSKMWIQSFNLNLKPGNEQWFLKKENKETIYTSAQFFLGMHNGSIFSLVFPDFWTSL